LQYLNIKCFFLLSTCYFVKLNKVIEKSKGLVSFIKRIFLVAFKLIFDNSFINKNILFYISKDRHLASLALNFFISIYYITYYAF
jgi:hypothetical protein